ncbi:MAG: SufD family Fe-S cluster assembly protein, partial [Patescibacteria group bacterium]
MTKRTVIVDVDRSPEQTFRIKRGEYVTVAIVARFPKQKEASIKVRLTGKGAKATILGIIIGKDDTQFSLHTLQLHEAPETTSNLLVKSVLSGKTQFHYDGA